MFRSALSNKSIHILLRTFKSVNSNKKSLSYVFPLYSSKFCDCESKVRNANIFSRQPHKVFSSSKHLQAHESTEDEKRKQLVDDVEFQSILKDFAKDFDVSDESQKILEDIKKSLDQPPEDDEPSKKFTASIKIEASPLEKKKFSEFIDSDSVTIHSHEDIISGAAKEELDYHTQQDYQYEVPTAKLQRGILGVYDIDELVDVLHSEKMENIAVISIPKALHYADYIVLVNAKSPRHSKASTENILKIYKAKKHKQDPFVKVEGENNADWKALDMGNIVLHIFSEETRDFYDIESLWLLDPEFDSGGTLKTDPAFDRIREQIEFFNSMQALPPVEKST